MEARIKVDISRLSEERGRRFAECILAGLQEYLKQPGAREALDARTAARHERRKQSGYESLPSVAH